MQRSKFFLTAAVILAASVGAFASLKSNLVPVYYLEPGCQGQTTVQDSRCSATTNDITCYYVQDSNGGPCIEHFRPDL